MDSDLTEDRIMYADVPVRGIRVLFPLIGNLFAWINLQALALLVVLGAGMVYGKNGEFIQKIRQAYHRACRRLKLLRWR